MRFNGFIGPSGKVGAESLSASSTVNMYLEVNPDTGQPTLRAMPGLKPVLLLPEAPVRGLYTTSTGRVFAVAGATLYEVFQGWTSRACGAGVPTAGPVFMTDNGRTLVLSVGGILAGLDLHSTAFAQITPETPFEAGRVDYLAGYIVTNAARTTQFYYSTLMDATTWPALNFYSAEVRPDPLLSCVALAGELWLPGAISQEVWVPTGDALAPFARQQAVLVEQGLAAPEALCLAAQTLFWLSGSPRGQGPLSVAQGYTPLPVSTPVLAHALARMGFVGDAVAYPVTQGHHTFVVVSFPSGGETWMYDVREQAWTELAALGEDGALGEYPCRTHCVAFDEHLFGDHTSGQLYIWAREYHRYGSRPRLCRRTAPHIRKDQQPISYNKFELVGEMGRGLDGGLEPGRDPTVLLEWSDDGGHAYGSSVAASLGTLGDFAHRAVWYRLGQAQTTRTFRVTVTDPVPLAWSDADLL